MSLVKNNAAQLAEADQGLTSSTSKAHIKEALDTAKREWKDAKKCIDEMSRDELEEFTEALDGVPLAKTGYVRIRLSPAEYAGLLLKAKDNETSITNVLLGDLT